MQDPKSYYESYGYYIFRQLIPQNLISSLLKEYQANILASKKPFFRQSTNRWELNKISQYGYSEESFLDVHDYPQHQSFSEATKAVFCCQEVRAALSALTGSSAHNLMQTMLFDMNTATPAHQDWYYLDSLPNGHLLGAWFALEDIHELAGRFYVFPKSHQVDFDLNEDEKVSKTPYLQRLEKYLSMHSDELFAPELQKGDLLFWNSRTIHGSSPTLDQKYSRKSLTAHYLPSEYQFGSRYKQIPSKVEYAEFEGMKYRLAPLAHKHYSLQTKLKTDIFEYMWQRPKLKRAYDFFKKPLKSFRA